MSRSSLVLALLAWSGAIAHAGEEITVTAMKPVDVFELEAAYDPRIAPDGSRIVYVRHSANAKDDRWHDELWCIDTRTGEQRPLASGERHDAQPRWSPDGTRIAYVSIDDGSPQIWVRWLDRGDVARVTNVEEGPGDVAWSPDGRMLAYTAFVEADAAPFVTMPTPPEGVKWSPPAKVITQSKYRADGAGYLRQGNTQLFVVPAEGGTPRALTRGAFDVTGPLSWTPDGRSIVFSSNRRADAELEPVDSEIYALDVATGAMRALTDRRGPDNGPTVSRDGKLVAYLGFDDRRQGHQVTRLYVVPFAGGTPTDLTASLDRDVENPVFTADGASIVFLFDDRGETKIGRVAVTGGAVTTLATGVGGMDFGRPYSAGAFSLANDGTIAFTATTFEHPADVALTTLAGEAPRRLTQLNADLLAQRASARIEALTVKSTHDGRDVGAWLVTPHDFDASKSYPLILEIHGGPFANYGPRFAFEYQAFASRGYCVLFVNPRGSTSYGEEFGNLIHHAYPGHDYDDLMSCVDAVLARGFVDPKRLYVTGGSGGGCLTAWIVGKTDRFAAAVAAKPVIDWTSFVLTSDAYPFFVKYWFPGPPWEHQDHYFARSPLSLVGNVKTPTMLMTGEEDWRTPISQSEEYYQALKLRGVDAALVRVPYSSHSMTNRPSQLVSKVLHIVQWFDAHGGTGTSR